MDDEYDPFLDMFECFFETPMTRLKEFKLKTISAFFQYEFMANLFLAFPNLETLEVN